MISYTLNEDGDVLVEKQEGVAKPVDFRFENINSFVHDIGVQFEDLQGLCLTMAVKIEKLSEEVNEYKNMASKSK